LLMARALIKLYTHKRLPYYFICREAASAPYAERPLCSSSKSCDGARKKFSAAEPRNGVY
jgi:hypothetical protein